MSENGEIYTAGKNFTLPLALTAWTNSTSDYQYGLSLFVTLICQCSTRNVNSCHVSKVFTTLSYLWFTCVSGKAWSWSVIYNLFGKKSSSKLRQSHQLTLFNLLLKNLFSLRAHRDGLSMYCFVFETYLSANLSKEGLYKSLK